MNVVNKYLATLSLFVCTLSAPAILAAEVGTRDAPNLIQCDTCYSVADFEQKAKSQSVSNDAGYHLVYNMNTEVVETVYTFELHEPELGISMSNARVVSTNALHAQQFSEYVDYKKYGVEKKPKLLEIKHAGGYDGIIYNYYKPARGSCQALKYSNFLPILVVIEFDNGDVVTALIPDPRSTAIELISAVDEDGKDISSRASNSGGASGGSGGGSEGGSSSGSVTVTITGVNSGGSTLMCKPKASYLGVDCKFV